MKPARRPWVGFGALTLLIALAGCSSSNFTPEPSERIAARRTHGSREMSSHRDGVAFWWARPWPSD
jgi:hypothetical protein